MGKLATLAISSCLGPQSLLARCFSRTLLAELCICQNPRRGYDYWTGASQEGGRGIEADAPLDRIPLYVRAGSILPLGPGIEYADEQPARPIELRIYPGADARFELYQNAGDSYDYENGAHSIIPLHWSESTRTLTIGDREGSYPEMPRGIEIRVVWVSVGRGPGVTPVANPDRIIEYAGKAISVQVPRNTYGRGRG
jgi:alpha-D-xyloside xylohydrolase